MQRRTNRRLTVLAGVMITSLALIARVQTQTASEPAAASIDALAWMAGSWTGAMGRAAIEEHWIAPRAKTMLAVSRTSAGERTVAFEFLRIEARADGIFYIAQPGGRPPTEFKLTRVAGESAVFENPQHDHPKIIRYTRTGTSMVAEIEGDENGRHVKQAFTYTLAAR